MAMLKQEEEVDCIQNIFSLFIKELAVQLENNGREEATFSPDRVALFILLLVAEVNIMVKGRHGSD